MKMMGESDIINSINSIKVLDYDLYSTILKRYGEGLDVNDINRVVSVLREPRVMDNLPVKIKIRSAGIQSGCKVTFLENYNGTVIKESDCYIKVSERKIPTNVKSMKILKAILKTGVSKDEDLALACREIFVSVLKRTNGMEIGEESIMDTMKMMKGYYFEEILAGIKEVV